MPSNYAQKGFLIPKEGILSILIMNFSVLMDKNAAGVGRQVSN
jgi:hypothetical protein